MPVTFRPMIRNFSSSFLIFSFVQMVSAQAPFSKWIVQSGDSVNTYALGHMDLVHLANNDLLQCTSRDAVGSLDKCRFVRLSPDGDPLQQWEVHAPYMDINKVIELADGSFACFGRINYSALYLHLASDGTPLLAKAYDVTGIGIIAPWRWNDAVQDDSSHFTLAGEWGGFVSTGMIARIQLDGTLDAYDLVHMGADPTFFQSVVRLSNGDHVFHGASNMPNYHSKTLQYACVRLSALYTHITFTSKKRRSRMSVQRDTSK